MSLNKIEQFEQIESFVRNNYKTPELIIKNPNKFDSKDLASALAGIYLNNYLNEKKYESFEEDSILYAISELQPGLVVERTYKDNDYLISLVNKYKEFSKKYGLYADIKEQRYMYLHPDGTQTKSTNYIIQHLIPFILAEDIKGDGYNFNLSAIMDSETLKFFLDDEEIKDSEVVRIAAASGRNDLLAKLKDKNLELKVGFEDAYNYILIQKPLEGVSLHLFICEHGLSSLIKQLKPSDIIEIYAFVDKIKLTAEMRRVIDTLEPDFNTALTILKTSELYIDQTQPLPEL